MSLCGCAGRNSFLESVVVLQELTPKLKVLWKLRMRDGIFKTRISAIQLCLNKRLREARLAGVSSHRHSLVGMVASKPWREVLAVALRKPVEGGLHLRQESRVKGCSRDSDPCQ